jgi:hypothetical protein
MRCRTGAGALLLGGLLALAGCQGCGLATPTGVD